MLEAIAIAALVVGGVSTATTINDGEAVAAEERKAVAVEVQQDGRARTERATNPFLD